MDNLTRLCIDFSDQVFASCLEIEKNNINSSLYTVNEVLKQILLVSKNIFFNSLKAEKCDTNFDYIDLLKSIIENVQESMYWFSLLFQQQFLTKENYDSLKKSSEEIEFIAQSTIKKINEHIDNVMAGFY